MTVTRTTRKRPPVSRIVGIGAVAGLIAAIVMAMYAMIAAATYQGTGLFTPMYHIASLVTGPTHMMTSVEQAMAGQPPYFAPGPAAVGMAIHLAVGLGFGALFGAIAGASGLRPAVTVLAGAVYGLVVLALNGFVLLPVAAAAFGAGEPIREMPSMAGWGTFILEHAIYGVVLGLGVALLTGRERAAGVHHDMEPTEGAAARLAS